MLSDAALRRVGFGVVGVAVAILFAACNDANSPPPAAQVPALAIAAVFPPDAAVGVEPRTEVRITFAEAMAAPQADTFVVADGLGPLGGLLDASADGRTWSWRPIGDLPRGGAIEVRLPAGLAADSGARLAADATFRFTVRESVLQPEAWTGNDTAGALGAHAWQSGAHAVVSGPQLIEVGPAGGTVVPLPLAGEPTAHAQAGGGRYSILTTQGYSPFALDVVRGELGGPVFQNSVPVPLCRYGRSELAQNQQGDMAVYWYGILANQLGADGLWWSRAGSAQVVEIPLPPAGSFPLRRVAVDGLGNVFVAYLDALLGRFVLYRHHAATAASESIDVAGAPEDFWIGGTGNGAVLVWRELQPGTGGAVSVLQARRYGPQGLAAPVAWQTGERRVDRCVAVADWGAVAVLTQHGPGSAAGPWWLQRAEANGQVGAPEVVHDGEAPDRYALAISPRGVAWLAMVRTLPDGRTELVLLRSRPNAPVTAPLVVHVTAEPGLQIRKVALAADDGGRAVVAFAEDRTAAPPVVRVLRFD